MTCQQGIVVVLTGRVEIREGLCGSLSLGGNSLIVHIVGGSGDVHISPSVVLHGNGTSASVGHLAVTLNAITQTGKQFGGNAFMVNACDIDETTVVVLAVGFTVIGAMAQRERTQCVSLQSHDDDAVGHRGKGCTTVLVTVLLEADRREGCLEVKLTAVVCHLVIIDAVVCQFQRTQRQVFLSVRSLDERLIDEVLGLFLLTFEDIVAHRLQIRGSRGAVVVMRTAAPERVLVQLYLVYARATENHTAKTAVADRQGFQPDAGGLVVPQPMVVDIGANGCRGSAKLP